MKRILSTVAALALIAGAALGADPGGVGVQARALVGLELEELDQLGRLAAAYPTPSPLPVVRDQHHGDVRDHGAGLDVGFHATMDGGPLLEVVSVRSGRRAPRPQPSATPEPIEQPHLLPPPRLHRFRQRHPASSPHPFGAISAHPAAARAATAPSSHGHGQW